MDVGVEINQYKVIEHIGRGGMADVWSAQDQRLNRMVAIKTIAHGLSQDADPINLFKTEAQTIAQMEHPHILPIYDFGEFEGQLYIVMRYVAGGSLEDMLRRGALPLNEVLRLGQAVAQALDYAHANKVIHLDLKPPNVLLDSHQSPYLADFGLASKLDREGKATNPGSGTLLYMAPEQLTAEIIDHRADIYSFCIVLFHMMTGQLPFEGSAPLALKQLQYHEELPDVDDINPNLPSYLTGILRQGTAIDPAQRPARLMDIINEMQLVLTTTGEFAAIGTSDDYAMSAVDPYSMVTEPMGDSTDMELLEAVDIYSRARHAWAGGNGRFLLGVTHFMIMNGYYMRADQHGLELDEPGMQMLLRGALEYEIEIDFWWDKITPDSRRWVCLHAVRSGNAPARVRALYRLETLPDSDKPQIPKLVAQALQVETNEEARLAALHVLGTRAKLMKRTQQFSIQTEYRGRMLTTMTRLGIQILPASDWQEVVYTPEIDLLLAEIALDYAMPRVAEEAARIIGRIRSTTAVRHIASQQRAGRRRALRALALVRDETPTLPPVVSVQGRFYAWMTNSLRRLSDKPLNVVWRYLWALFGGWAAMWLHVWVTFRSQAIFTPQRWGNSIAIGLIFGIFAAALVVLAGEFSSRLRGFWPDWVRLLASSIIGFLVGTFAWGQFTWFFLQQPPEWEMMQFGGVGLAFGVVVSAFFGLRSWLAIPLTAFTSYMPILIAWRYFYYFEPLEIHLPNWNFFMFLAIALGVGYIIAEYFNLRRRPEYLVVGLLVYGVGSVLVWRMLYGTATIHLIQDRPLVQVGILYFDYERQIYTLTIPFAILIALGAHMPTLIADVRWIISKLRKGKKAERVAPLPSVPIPRIAITGTMEAAAVAVEEKPLTEEVPVVEPPAPQPTFQMNDTSYPKTEMDVNQGLMAKKPAAPNLATEVDIAKGVQALPKVEPTKQDSVPRSRRVNFGTGIKVSQDTSANPFKRRTDPDARKQAQKSLSEESTEGDEAPAQDENPPEE